jgi:tetratricopeptide (TPR) repeat protein
MAAVNTTARVLATGALLLGLVAFAPPADAQGRRRGKKDRGGSKGPSAKAVLELRDGRLIEGVTVREATSATIKYRDKRRAVQETKAERVAWIRYTEPDPNYSSGMSQYRAGQYGKATSSFTKARGKSKEGEWGWVYATYGLGQAQLMDKKFDEAAKDFQRLLDKAPSDFLAPFAIYGLGEAQAGGGQHAKAIATFNKLNEKYGDYWRARCQIGIGEANLAKKDASGARKAFEFAKGRAGSFNELRQMAEVGVGKSYVLAKAWDRAIEFFDGIISQGGADPEVAGNAWVGKGDCLMAQAKAKGNDKKLLKEALIAYQTCSVRYAGIPEAYPKALYQSGVIYKKLGLDDLAKLQHQELKSRSPGSVWAGKVGK